MYTDNLNIYMSHIVCEICIDYACETCICSGGFYFILNFKVFLYFKFIVLRIGKSFVDISLKMQIGAVFHQEVLYCKMLQRICLKP